MAGPAAMIANIFARFAYIVEEGTTSVVVHMYWGFSALDRDDVCLQVGYCFEAPRCGHHSVGWEHVLCESDTCFVCLWISVPVST